MRIHSKWNVLQKFGFVVLFSYLILYINSTQFVLSGVLEKLWQKVIPFFANAIGFERSITVFTNGSGDTTYNYFQILFFAILSVVIALIVLIVDRKRNNYRTLLSWLTVLVRYYLAFQMINYGFQKLFYLQFVFPSELKLFLRWVCYGILWDTLKLTPYSLVPWNL